jgi:UDP-GlcNAc:undecaprenyl-phosphate GlcNAc-1-phosphate transferase
VEPERPDIAAIGPLTLLAAAMTAFFLTPLVIRLAARLGAFDRPGPRRIHRAPVPRIGGVAVFAGFLAGLLFAAYATGSLAAFPTVTVYWSSLAAGALAVFLLGLLDDIVGVAFPWKFAVQAGAAVLAWAGGFRIEALSHPFGGGALDLGLLSLPVTVIWIVGITNAVNLLDGLDGLAAGTALITTAAVALIAFHGGHFGVTATCIALLGSLLGFLPFNFNPARIFLGDSGSMFLGFVLAVISVRGSQKGATTVAVLAPLLVLGLPIADTAFAILRRVARLGRESLLARGGRVSFFLRNLDRVFLPDERHLHHRLLHFGLSHRGAVLFLYAGALLLALAALADVLVNSVRLAMILVAFLAVVTVALAVYLRANGHRGGEPAEEPSREEGREPIRTVRVHRAGSA